MFSFKEILENQDVKLDHMFISSLVNDIVKVNIARELRGHILFYEVSLQVAEMVR